MKKPSLASIVQSLLDQPEGTKFETKRVSGKMVHRALETICAFSNTEGGLLVIGLEDPNKETGSKRVYGLSENLEALAELKRKIKTHFLPPIDDPSILHLDALNRFGTSDQIAIIAVRAGTKVHSILEDGTWLRVDSTNREMNAAEITTLSYKRGVVSAEAEVVDVDLRLLNTEIFKRYCDSRGLTTGTIAQRLERIGLAKSDQGKCRPTRAAVLLFAQSPSDLLALSGVRAGVRVFQYSGTTIDRSEQPNLKKQPKNLAGPLYELIENTADYILGEISSGFKMAASGFETEHAYPKRVIKEAITNAILHRDYRYQRDVNIRIFDDRIEVESPGEFVANITPNTIEKAGSAPRNPSLVNHLREFPAPPNVDAGEGVPMMFSEMRSKGLYPPRYSTQKDMAIPVVTVTLLNERRPEIWEQVSAFLDAHGTITNKDLRKIANMETLKATRALKGWVEIGLLVKMGSGKRDTKYRKAEVEAETFFDLELKKLQNKQ